MKSLQSQINEAFKHVPTDVLSTLISLMSDYFVFAQNTRGMHWNLSGPEFLKLHETYGEIYDDLADGLDALAERIRQLDAIPPASVTDLSQSTLEHITTKLYTAAETYELYLSNADAVQNKLHAAQALAAKYDEGTNNMLSGFIACIEKQIWLIKSQQ